MHWRIRWAAAWLTIAVIVIFMIAGIVGTIEFVSSLLAEKEDPVSLKADFKVDVGEAEGRVMHVYKDSLGILTGGIGHKLTPHDRETLDWEHSIPNETVEQWFEIDYMKTMNAVDKYFSEFNDWPRVAQLAVLNFLWQLGPDAPKNFPHATEALQERRWNDAADEWEFANVRTRRHSKWYRETPTRCRQEVERLRHAATEESK